MHIYVTVARAVDETFEKSSKFKISTDYRAAFGVLSRMYTFPHKYHIYIYIYIYTFLHIYVYIKTIYKNNIIYIYIYICIYIISSLCVAS